MLRSHQSTHSVLSFGHRACATQPSKVFKLEQYHSWPFSKRVTFKTADGTSFTAKVWSTCKIRPEPRVYPKSHYLTHRSNRPEIWLSNTDLEIQDSVNKLIEERIPIYQKQFETHSFVNAVCSNVTAQELSIKLDMINDRSITSAIVKGSTRPTSFMANVRIEIEDYQRVCKSYLNNMWAREDRLGRSVLIISCTGFAGYLVLFFIRSQARLDVHAETCNHEAVLASRNYEDVVRRKIMIYVGLVGAAFITDWICDLSIFSNPCIFGLPLFLVRYYLHTQS